MTPIHSTTVDLGAIAERLTYDDAGVGWWGDPVAGSILEQHGGEQSGSAG